MLLQLCTEYIVNIVKWGDIYTWLYIELVVHSTFDQKAYLITSFDSLPFSYLLVISNNWPFLTLFFTFTLNQYVICPKKVGGSSMWIYGCKSYL